MIQYEIEVRKQTGKRFILIIRDTRRVLLAELDKSNFRSLLFEYTMMRQLNQCTIAKKRVTETSIIYSVKIYN